jgi:hypothetical protein
MELLSLLMGMMAIPSAIGAFSYLFLRLKHPDFILLAVSFLLGCCFQIGLSRLWVRVQDAPFLLLIIAVPCCVAGTWASRKTEGKADLTDWAKSYGGLCTSTSLSFLLGIVAYCAYMYPKGQDKDFAVWIRYLYYLLAIISPSLTPFILLLMRNLRLRHGIDR